MKLTTARAIASLAAAAACGPVAYATQGQTGLGWFVVALIIIWNW